MKIMGNLVKKKQSRSHEFFYLTTDFFSGKFTQEETLRTNVANVFVLSSVTTWITKAPLLPNQRWEQMGGLTLQQLIFVHFLIFFSFLMIHDFDVRSPNSEQIPVENVTVMDEIPPKN